MKVIFMTSNPFIEQQAIDMYTTAIKSRYNILLWDLSIIYGRVEKVSNLVHNGIKIKSLNEFDDLLKREVQQEKIVIVTNMLIPQLSKVFSIIKKYNIDIVNINKEGLPAWLAYTAAAERRNELSIKDRIKYTLKKLKNKIQNATCLKKVKYDYLMSSYDFYPNQRKKFIKIHHIKYDEFLAAQSEESIINGKYILFVDAAYVGHPMFANSSKAINEKEYINALNKYFDMLEKKYDMPVIISSHPKALYEEGDFNGRDIIKYKTPILVKHAAYIVSHYSTSLIDAVLLNKPLKIMYSEELLNSSTRNCVLMGIKLSELLNIDLVNLDEPILLDFHVDTVLYKKFIDEYVLNYEKCNMTNKDIIIGFLESLDREN